MKRVVLVIRDGWGYRQSKRDNALANSDTLFTDELMKKYPNVLLAAHDGAVGLPPKYMGNSEVGHMTLGSGRIIKQALERINCAILDKSFFNKIEFLKAIANAKKKNGNLHIVGLIQEEGVHSHLNHLFALLDLCNNKNFYDVKLHLFTDGRDSPVDKGLIYLKKVEKKLQEIGFGEVASISGRYYAMDRDNRWDRTRTTYLAIAEGKSKDKFLDATGAVVSSYKKKVYDEFILPTVKNNYKGITNKDSLVFFNYRTDRARQLMKAFSDKKFSAFERKNIGAYYVAMTEYYHPMASKVAFFEPFVKNNLGEVISKAGLSQLRISETEKYAHVTFFFNSQIEKPNKRENRIIIPSPKVATYDLKPEMSVFEIANRLSKEFSKEKYDFVVVNLVNGDMVGHTANVPAIKKACASVDLALKKIVESGQKYGYDFLILADHGNAEDQRKGWETSHTVNPVPCILVTDKKCSLREGRGLSDVAPTILDLLGIKQPKEMTGLSLIK